MMHLLKVYLIPLLIGGLIGTPAGLLLADKMIFEAMAYISFIGLLAVLIDHLIISRRYVR